MAVGYGLPLLERWRWETNYRSTYYALVTTALPLLIADPDLEHFLRTPEPRALAAVEHAAWTPGFFLNLQRAAQHLPLLLHLAAPASYPLSPIDVTLVEEPARNRSDLLVRQTVLSARYAAIYDFFFDPQEEVHNALET
jgi:hypothetical protein